MPNVQVSIPYYCYCAGTVLIALSMCLAAPSWGAGLSLSSVPAAATADVLFQRLDADRDGLVSRAEAALQPGLLEYFDQADSAHAGVLDREGFRRAQALYAYRQLTGFVDDSDITARIKAALQRPGVQPLPHVEVSTLDGVVRLYGRVDSAQQAQRVGLIAAATAGVKSVQNELIFKSQEPA